jgi:hypothetical protein
MPRSSIDAHSIAWGWRCACGILRRLAPFCQRAWIWLASRVNFDGELLAVKRVTKWQRERILTPAQFELACLKMLDLDRRDVMAILLDVERKAQKRMKKADKRRKKQLNGQLELDRVGPAPTGRVAYPALLTCSSPHDLDRVPPGLDAEGQALHSKIAKRARRDGTHFFVAMSALTGNPRYGENSDLPEPPEVGQGRG